MEHSYCSPQNNIDISTTCDNKPPGQSGQNSLSITAKIETSSSMCLDDIKAEKPLLVDASTQTAVNLTDLGDYTDQHLKEPSLLKRHLFINDVMKDDKSCKFHTGIISLQLLMYLYNWLQSKAERLTWKGDETSNNPGRHDGRGRALSTFESFLLILVRLRRGLDVEHLSDVFGIAPSTISRYFRTWLEFMSRELSFLIIWPSQEQVRATYQRHLSISKKLLGLLIVLNFLFKSLPCHLHSALPFLIIRVTILSRH